MPRTALPSDLREKLGFKSRGGQIAQRYDKEGDEYDSISSIKRKQQRPRAANDNSSRAQVCIVKRPYLVKGSGNFGRRRSMGDGRSVAQYAGGEKEGSNRCVSNRRCSYDSSVVCAGGKEREKRHSIKTTELMYSSHLPSGPDSSSGSKC